MIKLPIDIQCVNPCDGNDSDDDGDDGDDNGDVIDSHTNRILIQPC